MTQAKINGQDADGVYLIDAVTGLPYNAGSPPANPATIKTGQAVIVVTGTAVPLSAASVPLVNGLIIKSRALNNPAGATIGPAGVTNATNGAGNGYILDPGEPGSFGVTNANVVYVNGTAGDVFSWEGN